MEERCTAYLSLLEELQTSLDRLSELARQKIDAVRRDDLLALDEVIKEEQVLSLSLRSLEQRRGRLLAELGLDGVPLSGLTARFPAQLQPRATQTVRALQRSYESYRTASEVARSTLECNLHEIEKVIASHGGDARGVGYLPPDAQPPKNMKTDFRA